MQLKPHQEQYADLLLQILAKYGWGYLAGEVRTGKTLIALRAAGRITTKDVLFVTKKKAIGGVEKQYGELVEHYGVSYSLTVINDESMHLIEQKEWGVIIFDEHHSRSAFPKPSKRAQDVKAIIPIGVPVIMLSGTPHPESWSQLYHQFWILGDRSPWAAYANFYKWAKDYVIVKQRKFNGFTVNDYSHGISGKIWDDVKHGFLTLSQADAGIVQKTNEHILHVPMKEATYKTIARLLKDKVYEMDNGELILADTPVKLQSKLHQIFSGTMKDENENAYIIDRSKAEFIKQKFQGKKIAIFYKFNAEGDMLKETFPNWTDSDQKFMADPELTYICQVQSGREGTNLSCAYCLVMFNIDFSATSYFQAKDRMVNMHREGEINLYWIFSAPCPEIQIGQFPSMEAMVYDAVSKKKPYTVRYFERDFLKGQPIKLF